MMLAIISRIPLDTSRDIDNALFAATMWSEPDNTFSSIYAANFAILASDIIIIFGRAAHNCHYIMLVNTGKSNTNSITTLPILSINQSHHRQPRIISPGFNRVFNTVCANVNSEPVIISFLEPQSIRARKPRQ